MKSVLVTLALLLICGCSAQSGVGLSSGASGDRSLVPQQAHAIPIGTPAPASYACPAHRLVRANCGAQQRDDVRPLHDALTLDPSHIPGLHPVDLQAAYHLGTASTGSIAIVVPYGYDRAPSDLAVYRSKFSLPVCDTSSGCLNVIDLAPQQTAQRASWSAETAIDLEIASAACPQCSLILVEAASDRFDDLQSAIERAAAAKPAVISMSWGIPESALASAPRLAHDGVAVVAGTGDRGYGVTWPASDPSVIAVGGTTLTPDPQSVRGFSERAWTQAGYGCSALFAAPSWQRFACSGRAVADLSAVADPATGVAVYDSQPTGHGYWGNVAGWAVYGGTSVATPIVAAAIAQSSDAPQLSTPKYLYDHPALLNPVTTDGSPLQAGLGSPNGSDGI